MSKKSNKIHKSQKEKSKNKLHEFSKGQVAPQGTAFFSPLSKGFSAPHLDGETLTIWFYGRHDMDSAKFINELREHHIGEHMGSETEPWNLFLPKELHEKCKNVLDCNVLLLKEIYQELLDRLSVELKESLEMPRYAKFEKMTIYAKNNEKKSEALAFVVKAGFCLFVEDNVLKTAYYPPEYKHKDRQSGTLSESLLKHEFVLKSLCFRNAKLHLLKKLDGTVQVDDKNGIKWRAVSKTLEYITPRNW